MHNYTFHPVEVARIVSAELGVTIDPDFEPVLLFSNNISDLEWQPPVKNYWYFGDFVIAGYDQFLSSASIYNLGTPEGDLETLSINAPGGLNTNKNVFRGVLWNLVGSWQNITGYFYGYKLNRARGWVAQTPNYSLSTGWSLASGVYTHSSGTNELGISGAWLLGSPSLRMTITFTGITAGSLSVELDSSGPIGTITANGTYTFSFTPDALDSAINLIPTSNFNGSFAESSVIIEKYDYI
jgi:hypothetical protein